MAESMNGLKRSHRCTEVTKADIGSTVTLMGWVQKSRNKGGIVSVSYTHLDVYKRQDCGNRVQRVYFRSAYCL